MAGLIREGAKGALLDIYEDALLQLQESIKGISDEDLITVVLPDDPDEDSRSIQSVLAHVVGSSYSYAIYIRTLKGTEYVRPDKKLRMKAADYIQDLKDSFLFNLTVFHEIEDSDLASLKIMTRWKQLYDIEQLTEHAIVHILRHTRQIEKFKLLLNDRR
ncbi:hypothetical protein D3C85_916600 [compost metagenome]